MISFKKGSILNSVENIAKEVSLIMPQVHRVIWADYLQKIDLPPTQVLTIIMLNDYGSCNLKQLGELLSAAAPTITGIVDRLEKNDYVQRVPDKNDRRSINIHLTSKGSSFAKKMRSLIQKRWEFALERIEKADSENFLRILKKISGAINEK